MTMSLIAGLALALWTGYSIGYLRGRVVEYRVCRDIWAPKD